MFKKVIVICLSSIFVLALTGEALSSWLFPTECEKRCKAVKDNCYYQVHEEEGILSSKYNDCARDFRECRRDCGYFSSDKCENECKDKDNYSHSESSHESEYMKCLRYCHNRSE